MLYRNALVMYDRETETLWSHFTGDALAGPLEGKQLEIIAVTPRVRFEEWLEGHPNSLVLRVGKQSSAKRSDYNSYYSSSRTGVSAPENVDERLAMKSFVLGMTDGSESIAYPLDIVREKGVINDRFAGAGIVLFSSKDGSLVGAYERPNGVGFAELVGRFLVTDDGDRYDAVNGTGPDGEQLKQIPVIRSYWFAWADYHPETEVYEQ